MESTVTRCTAPASSRLPGRRQTRGGQGCSAQASAQQQTAAPGYKNSSGLLACRRVHQVLPTHHASRQPTHHVAAPSMDRSRSPCGV